MQPTSPTKLGEADLYLSAKQIRGRYGGMSDMSLWRWLRDDSLDFPQPIRINNRRFWLLSDLLKWERERGGRAASWHR